MPVVIDPVRKLATVGTITNLRPIEGADAIEQASVRGWTLVVKKGEFSEGARVVYFEEDTALPLDDERFAFLRPRGAKVVEGREYHVLKIARLRGVYSQGLALPLEAFQEELALALPELQGGAYPQDDTDLTEALGLGKWEPPLTAGSGEQVGAFTSAFSMKSDSERLQNLLGAWEIIKAHPWEATEKLDGTSLTLARDLEGNLRVNSRNWEIREGDNLYWNVVKTFSLGSFLNPGEALQAELVGPGINGNRQDVKEVRPFVFTFSRERQPLGRTSWPEGLEALAVPVVPLELPETPQELLDLVDGMKSLVNPSRLAEGLVFHEAAGALIPELGGRDTFKVISGKYLTKSKD